MLGIVFLCQGENSTCSHWQQCVYLSRSSHWCWACCTKKLFSTCGVKILEKYLWRCTFFSKVACWRPETLLKLTSFTGNFKGFCPQIHRTAANFRKAFWRTLFLQNTSRWLFLSFKSFTKVLRVFQFYFDILLHRKCQTLLVVSSLLKKTRLAIYVYIWLPRNNACGLKHKQTWPEQAFYMFVVISRDLCNLFILLYKISTKTKTFISISRHQILKS